MKSDIVVTQRQLAELLVNVAVVRPVMIWGQPGIGKSALVEQFAASLGMPCVSLLGTQLAPEDLIGVPQITSAGTSRFCPPATIARADEYCLFLDEINGSSPDVQKAFYSLIHDRRLGEYMLPAGSVVVGAGNRATDHAIVRPMPSALMNRMVHVTLKASSSDWLAWATEHAIHPWIVDYVRTRPDHLVSEPPRHDEPFSSPRAWHILSDAIREFGDRITDEWLEVLAYGTLTASHATTFRAFVRTLRTALRIEHVIAGDAPWPARPEDRDLLYFLAQAFRVHLAKFLPAERGQLTDSGRELAHLAKRRMTELAAISLEMARIVVARDTADRPLPTWFFADVARDLPRLAEKMGTTSESA